MIPAALRSMLLASRTGSGAFPSVVHLPGGPVEDENAFATALLLDLLAGADRDAAIEALYQDAIRFLLRCRRASGAFAFYPADAHPAWIGEALPCDADDTALASLALLRAGAWGHAELTHQVHATLVCYRLERCPRGAPWFRSGVYPTWLDAARLRNPIDVCVNLNVAVLVHLARADPDPGYGGILEMVHAALDWAGDEPDRARAITPYYPHPAELGHALRRAVRSGLPGADHLLKRYLARPWSRLDAEADAPICCSLGAGVVWSSPLLQAARACMASDKTPLI